MCQPRIKIADVLKCLTKGRLKKTGIIRLSKSSAEDVTHSEWIPSDKFMEYMRNLGINTQELQRYIVYFGKVIKPQDISNYLGTKANVYYMSFVDLTNESRIPSRDAQIASSIASYFLKCMNGGNNYVLWHMDPQRYRFEDELCKDIEPKIQHQLTEIGVIASVERFIYGAEIVTGLSMTALWGLSSGGNLCSCLSLPNLGTSFSHYTD